MPDSGNAGMVRQTAGTDPVNHKHQENQSHHNEQDPNAPKKTDERKSADNDAPKKRGTKEQLTEAGRRAIIVYNNAYTQMNARGELLYQERLRAADTIDNVAYLINSIAHRPKTFDEEINKMKTRKASFLSIADYSRETLENKKNLALNGTAGVLSGVAVVEIAPSVAMWTATTFGTASTGTAISLLSGAAAQNAALAWLGGGALAAGGGGIGAGQALLALAGPIGWSLAGVTLLSSIVLFGAKEFRQKKKQAEQITQLRTATEAVDKTTAQIQELLDETIVLKDSITRQYRQCLGDYNRAFDDLTSDEQLRLGALVNNTAALSSKMREQLNGR